MLARVLASEWKGGRMLLLIKSVGSLLAMVVAVLAYTFWPEQAQVFDRPTAEVRNLLKELDLPPHVFGSEPKTFKVLTPSPETMVWSITANVNEEMRYVVTLAAEGARATRVRVDVTRANLSPSWPRDRQCPSETNRPQHLYHCDEGTDCGGTRATRL
jgi:hypothetical protein